MFDVILIGCGITGAATAYELSKYRLSVAVLERENDVACGATKANSAILHAGYDPEPGSLMARCNVRGAALARELCRKLDVPYRPTGSLVIAFHAGERAALEALYARGLRNGVPGLELLDGSTARALEPSLSPQVIAALHAPTAAICSPWEYCLALAETAVRNGVQVHLSSGVTAIRRVGGGWRLETASGSYEARCVLNAAGLQADRVHDLAAPHAFTLRGVRGQYHLLDKSEGSRVSHVVFPCPGPQGKGVLVAPTVHGNLIVGPNAEPVEGGDTATTSQGLAYVREKALRAIPSICFQEDIRSFAGVRAVAEGGDFLIREAEGAPGFFDLAGICSPGLTAAPAVAEYAVELLGAAGLPLRLKPDFICERKRLRFHTLSPEAKTALVRQRPEYGRVICRCETVTEGEILDALRAPIPPRSLDGLKRRTNTGMGRCQGGFCAPRLVELLSDALGIPATRILQEGAGTWLLAGETKGGPAHV